MAKMKITDLGKGKIIELKYWRWSRPKEKVLLWVAYRLPRKLVAWVGIRIVAHATSGKYSSQIVPDLTAMEALKRWDEPEESEDTSSPTPKVKSRENK